MSTVLGFLLLVGVILGLLGLCAIMYSSVLADAETDDRTRQRRDGNGQV
jgi:hypothetical protein